MEDFEKNLLKMRKTNRTVPTVLLIAAAFFLLFGFFCIPRKDRPFDPTSGGYASLNIVYVMGPFAEQTSDGRTVKNIMLPKTTKVTGLSSAPKAPVPFLFTMKPFPMPI